MSATTIPANLADLVRAQAKNRGNALAFEFEGRQTTFADFNIKTNRVANALIALGLQKGDRIAYLGKNSDVYFELLMGAMKAGAGELAPRGPGSRLHRRRLQGAGAVRRSRVHYAGEEHQGAVA
jgi:non-ribosomal peptide synthetase component F